jgi:hypothetical protein
MQPQARLAVICNCFQSVSAVLVPRVVFTAFNVFQPARAVQTTRFAAGKSSAIQPDKPVVKKWYRTLPTLPKPPEAALRTTLVPLPSSAAAGGLRGSGV